MITDLFALAEEEEEDLSELTISPFDRLPSILVHGRPSDLSKKSTFSIMKNLNNQNLTPILNFGLGNKKIYMGSVDSFRCRRHWAGR